MTCYRRQRSLIKICEFVYINEPIIALTIMLVAKFFDFSVTSPQIQEKMLREMSSSTAMPAGFDLK